jgi:HAD superfamily hydrolase (TIGR01549 family)
MPAGLKAVIFDVDGVLIDSLAPHLKICQDKSDEYGLGLGIPDAQEFKEMVRRNVRISPMEYFFQAVGFSEKDAARATADYQKDFMRLYAPKAFADAARVIRALRDASFRLGIVTSNYRINVEGTLGDSMRLFDAELIFTHDDMERKSKAAALKEIIAKLGIESSACAYVGDQPGDWRAAREAGCTFIGVTYGWGISQADTEFPTFASLAALGDYFLEGVALSAPKLPSLEECAPTKQRPPSSQ